MARSKKQMDRVSSPWPDGHPCTLDGRYFVVRGRLWRLSNPALDLAERERLVHELMAARRAVRTAKGNADALHAARARVDAAKRALGERGPPWWTDGAPDYNRHMVIHTPYADWFISLGQEPLTKPPCHEPEADEAGGEQVKALEDVEASLIADSEAPEPAEAVVVRAPIGISACRMAAGGHAGGLSSVTEKAEVVQLMAKGSQNVAGRCLC